MKKHTILTGVSLMVFAGALLATSSAWALDRTTQVSGSSDYLPQPADKEWVDEDGIWHLRGERADMGVYGDLQGDGYYIAAVNLDTTTWDGDAHGIISWDVSLGDLKGNFTGRFNQTFTNMEVTGQYVARGSGDFEGMKLKIWFSGNLGEGRVRYWTGYIHNPHGK